MPSCLQSNDIRNDKLAKLKKLERYGKLHFNHKYKINNILLDSFWEFAFYIYHRDKKHKIEHEPNGFSYYFENEEHLYYPDFKINNRYYEIKGEQFIIRYKNGNIKLYIAE